MIERVKYDAYGNALHHRGCDIDGDRDADGADATAINNLILVSGSGGSVLITAGAYKAEFDLDRSGAITSADSAMVSSNTGAALTSGLIGLGGASSGGGIGGIAGPDNPIGYSGYVFNAETRIYTVRHRHYWAALGTWITRDPLDYVDGGNLYEYVGGMPLSFTDPSGLERGGDRGPSDFGQGRGARDSTINKFHRKNCNDTMRRWCSSVSSPARFEREWKAFDCDKLGTDIIYANNSDIRTFSGAYHFVQDPHNTLDLIGMVPVIGIFADAANVVLYLVEGDYLMAGVSLAAAIPVFGDAFMAGKLAAKHGDEVGGLLLKRADDAAEAGLRHADEAADVVADGSAIWHTLMRHTEGSETLVIGRMDDLGKIGESEYTLIPRLVGDLGSPKLNWKRNAGELRKEMRLNKPIRDISDPLDKRGQFLRMEPGLLKSRGWVYRHGRWEPPA